MEAILVGIFLHSREAYDKFIRLVPSEVLTPTVRELMSDLGVWYEDGHDTPAADLAAFRAWVRLVRHPSWGQSRQAEIDAVIGRAAEEGARPSRPAQDLVRSLILRERAAQIAEAADRYASGDTTEDLWDTLPDAVEAAKVAAQIADNHEAELCVDADRVWRSVYSHGHGLHWRSPSLEAMLGPIRKGNLICLAGYTDSGKSSIVASEATYMAGQLKGDQRVLWFNNEEAGDAVLAKIIRAAIGASAGRIEAAIKAGQGKAVEEAYTKAMGGLHDRIVMIDSSRITTGLVRRKLRQYNAGLVVFDQLYKVLGVPQYGDDSVQHLHDLYIFGRGIAKEHCPVIAIHQCDGEAYNQEFPGLPRLMGSRVAVQSEADAIVMLGRNIEHDHLRYLHAPKNKMPSPGVPSRRSEQVHINVDWDKVRFDV